MSIPGRMEDSRRLSEMEDSGEIIQLPRRKTAVVFGRDDPTTTHDDSCSPLVIPSIASQKVHLPRTMSLARLSWSTVSLGQ